MRLPSLESPGEFIEVPRWLAGETDYRHLDGKRALVEVAFSHKYHAIEIGTFTVHGPDPAGRFAVDLAFPCPGSVTSLKSYIHHLSVEQLKPLRPVRHSSYDFTYAGVLSADHPFTSSFTDAKDVASAGGAG
jgi:hypothetical protein